MRLYSYILTADSGFAPNPFFGCCTLACCKPQIRRAAQRGDWIVGLSPKARGNRIVYAMQISEKLTFAEYWRDPRFEEKQPHLHSADPERQAGDNIYEPLGDGAYRQHPSVHNAKHETRDLGGEYVLVARDFVYFGCKAIALPKRFVILATGRATKSKFPADVVEAFLAFIASRGFGIHGKPTLWPLKCGKAVCRAAGGDAVC